ncbi:hypothetical protein YC2023_022888 [Brassica napus]
MKYEHDGNTSSHEYMMKKDCDENSVTPIFISLLKSNAPSHACIHRRILLQICNDLGRKVAKRISVAPRDDHANSHISTKPVRARVLEQHDDLFKLGRALAFLLPHLWSFITQLPKENVEDVEVIKEAKAYKAS